MSVGLKKYRTVVTCKYCGATGLQWQRSAAGYRLYETVPNGDGTVSIDDTKMHACIASGTAGAAAPTLPLETPSGDAGTVDTLLGASEPTMASAAAGKGIVALKATAPWHEVLHTLWESGSRRLLIAGPPGTGKTTTSLQVLNTVYRVTMTEGTGVEDLLGAFQLRKVKEEDATPQTIWVDGPMVRAMREGKGVLIDEIDKMPPEIQSLMYAAMDDHPEVMLPTGELVKAIEGYGVIATTNSNLAVLPEAIIDRVEAGLVACIPHPDSIAHLPVAERNAVANYFRDIAPDAWTWAGSPTVRRMRSFCRLVAAGTMTDELVANVVFGKAGKEVLSALTTSGRKVVAK